VANFRRGAQAIQQAAERKNSGKFTPTIRWKAGEKKYIIFLQPIDEVVTVLYHNFIIIGHSDATNKPIYSSYISRRDPELDGKDGYDELWDRFQEPPKERCLGLAVELVPVTEKVNGRNKIVSFDFAVREFENKDGENVQVPAVGLIIESPYTFWGYLSTFADDAPIESVVFAVTRRGGGTDTAYDFVSAGDAPEVGDALDEFFATFDFDAYLEDLASEERMKEEIGPLPDDWVVNPYSKKRKNEKGKKASAGNTRFNRAAASEAEEEGTGEDAAPEAGAEPEEDQGSAARRRFSALKKDFGKTTPEES
jgi:hypothetical protein